VALKILAPELARDVGFRERFLRESRLAASLEHPNVVPIHDAGEVGEELYIAMRFVEGADLKQLLVAGPLEPGRAVALVSQVASALDAAHARGLVHRDVKPSNVLVTGDDHVYLADFGLTRRLAEPTLAVDASRSLGTADYVAPEQIRGDDVDGRADLYSLGCLLHECLTGKPPFRRDSEVATLFAHLEEEPPAPAGLEGVMRTALAKEPDDRFQSGRELVEAARSALGLEPKRVRWPLAVAAMGVALLGAALLAYFLTSSGGGTPVEAGADSVVRVDPRTNTVSSTMPVGRQASGVAVGSDAVWVTSLADGTMTRIDSRTMRVRTIRGLGAPTGVALAGGTAVVAGGSAHKVTAFDAASGTLGYSASLRGPSNGTLQVGGGSSGVWFADPAGRIVGKIDETLVSGSPASEVAVTPDRRSLVSSYVSFAGVAVGKDAVWVAGDARDRAVWRLDPVSGRSLRIQLPFAPAGIAVGEGGVWVPSLLEDTVSRLDPKTNQIVATIRVGRGVSGIAAGEGAVWVASSIAGTVSRIDPGTNRVAATLDVGGTPEHIAAGAGGVWITTSERPRSVPGNAITIGVLSDCEGTYGPYYNDTVAPAELPLIERGGSRAGPAITDGVDGVTIAGRPVRLAFGCADGSTTSGLAEARRLVEQVGVDILIGPETADQGLALQEYARRHPGVAFVNGSSMAQQLKPAANFFSFWYDGAQSMAGLGAYAYDKLGWRTAVTIAGADAFDWAQAAGFDAEFCALGGRIVKRIWIPQFAQDFSGLVAQIPKTGVDGFLDEAQGPDPLLTIARHVPGLRGNLGRKVVIGTTVTWTPQLGNRVRGLVSAGPTLHPRPGYLGRLRADFPEIRKDFLGSPFDYSYYDAMTATLEALEEVNGDLSGGERRFMTALSKVTLDAPNGPTHLSTDRQAVAPNALIMTDGPYSAHEFATIRNVDHGFGGYFKPTDPPPSETTPACVKRPPPRWAR
jgi:YVTN family beta-propeller protein